MPRGIPNNPRQAKNNPVAPTGGLETEGLPLGHTVRKTSEESQVGEPELVQVAERMPDDEKLAMLAFMNESIDIRPTRTTDPKEQVFEITINGRSELFKVGEVKTVKRYYADHMLRSKVTSYTQREVTNGEGVKQMVNLPYTTLKYDFAIVHDPNPKSDAWFKATLGMAG
jgi:hypothetical protein